MENFRIIDEAQWLAETSAETSDTTEATVPKAQVLKPARASNRTPRLGRPASTTNATPIAPASVDPG